MLERLEHWARTTPDRIYLTQPLPDGTVVEYSWARVCDEARRMAAHLHSLGLPVGSNIAIYGKNCAHWIMADLAIWLAGHVSVPIYPTASSQTADYVLRHCDARLIFIGRVDGVTDSWVDMQRILPATLPKIGLPMSPATISARWGDLIAAHEPLSEAIARDGNALATIIYTSGTTGQSKGVVHSFNSLTAPCVATATLWDTNTYDRMLSYLPLAHIAERVGVEVPSLVFGLQVFSVWDWKTLLGT